MNIKGTPYQISWNRAREYWWRDSSESLEWNVAITRKEIDLCRTLYDIAKSRTSCDNLEEIVTDLKNLLKLRKDNSNEYKELSYDDVKNAVKRLMDFFSEFSFEPNFRFINSLVLSVKSSYDKGVEFVNNYFELIDSPHLNSISEKMKSPEFKMSLTTLSKSPVSERVNKRFKLYYGSQGVGKTTNALEESGGSCMVCHSAILPQDLMEDFKFVDGKAEFAPSALQMAMIEGQKIVLDEINLLPFESLRFLQSILDGKKSFTYKDKVIDIKEGFQVIGTMNLVVNGCSYPLPEPLVDRAQELKKFRLTAKDLVEALA